MLHKLLILNAFILFLAWCLTVQAANKTCRTESACFKPHVGYRVSNNEIVDVCNNYRSGDWKYRRCNAEANRLFKEKCHDVTKDMRNAKGSQRNALKKKQDLYCGY